MTDLSFFIYSGLINAVTSFGLCAFVLRKNFTSALNRTFALFAFSVGYWSIGYACWLSTTSADWALIFIRHTMIGAIFIPSTFTHFSLILLDKKERWRLFIILNYVASGVFLLFSFSSFYISGLQSRFIFPFWPVPGFIFHLMLFHFVVNVLLSHFILWKGIKEKKGAQRDQIQYVFAGTFIGFLGGSTNYFLWYGIPIFPYLNILVTVYICAVAYAIVKFRFLDIEFIIRRTLVFAGLVSFVFGVFAFSMFVTQELLSKFFSGSRNVPLLVSIVIVVLAYDPLRRLLVHTTDRFFFQKRFDYEKLLRDASAGISKIKSLHHLLSLVVHFVTMRVRVKSAAVLMYDERNQYYKFCYPRGYSKDHRLRGGVTLACADPLIQYLAKECIPISLDYIQERLEEEASESKSEEVVDVKAHTHDYRSIKLRLEELESSCCVPSFLGKDLKNILVLGEKKSGDFYTEQDLNVLFTLAQESAIAIENARLYDVAIEKAQELESINNELNGAQNQLIHALSETEVANKRLRDTHAQLIHEQKMATLGRLASSVGHEVNNPLTILSMNVSRAILKYRRNPDLKVSEILDVFQKMEQNISRIKAVVNTLTGLLKKSEHGKFEPLSLKLVLEETLPLVQFQTYLENLSGTEVVFEIPGNIPLIKGDLERLQEVFLNLFINAYHAMMGKRNRKISVCAYENPAHPAMVTVEFSDNGSGMTDDVMKKIFSYGFTTKPSGKGSGMGLYMCRYIIELHGGEIKVRSRMGEGTSFLITLPTFSEGTGSRKPPPGKKTLLQ